LASKVGESLQEDQTLRNLSTKIEVRDGKLFLDDLNTRIDRLGDLKLGGGVGILNQNLEFAATLLLSEDVSKRLASGSLLGLLGGSSQRIELPLTVGGTVAKPDVSINMDKLTQDAGKNLLKGLGDKLKK
jgi:hypothetical protein